VFQQNGITVHLRDTSCLHLSVAPCGCHVQWLRVKLRIVYIECAVTPRSYIHAVFEHHCVQQAVLSRVSFLPLARTAQSSPACRVPLHNRNLTSLSSPQLRSCSGLASGFRTCGAGVFKHLEGTMTIEHGTRCPHHLSLHAHPTPPPFVLEQRNDRSFYFPAGSSSVCATSLIPELCNRPAGNVLGRGVR
jgi:hypothetical protein